MIAEKASTKAASGGQQVNKLCSWIVRLTLVSENGMRIGCIIALCEGLHHTFDLLGLPGHLEAGGDKASEGK
jgi:hypothetical protein